MEALRSELAKKAKDADDLRADLAEADTEIEEFGQQAKKAKSALEAAEAARRKEVCACLFTRGIGRLCVFFFLLFFFYSLFDGPF